MIRLIEILTKKVTQEKENKNKVYFQDVDNLYPNRIKGLIESSPTAFRSANLMAKFIVGKGLVDETLYSKIIDKGLNLNTYDFSNVLAKQIAYQNAFFVHISYKLDIDNEEIIPAYCKVIPFEDGRISRTDDDGYLGKLLVKEWDKKASLGGKSHKTKEYYSFTRKQDELIEQIKDNWKEVKGKANFDLIEAIKIFKGQYYYFNPNVGDIYPLAPIHAVMNNCDTEYRIDNYTNLQFRQGLVGKSIVVTNGITGEDEEAMADILQDFLGENNSGNVIHYPIESLSDGQKLEDVLKVIQIPPQYNEDFFAKTIVNIRKSIMAAFNNIPEALVSASDGSLFGTSADTYTEMKKFYSEQNDELRKALQKFFKDVYDINVEYLTFGSEIVEIHEDENTKSQSALRGSVGGVTALIDLQKSVSQGYTERDSAIEILMSIYGVSEETALKMIGEPVITEPETEEV